LASANVARLLARWVWPLLFCAALWVVSSRPGPSLPPSPFFGFDKVVHLVAFAPLGFTLARALPHAPALAVLLGALYGVIDEWHQAHVPGRMPSAGDAVADALGTLIGVLVWGRRSRLNQ
jgi:VanZ family protein